MNPPVWQHGLTATSFRWRVVLLLGLTAGATCAMLAVPPFAQPLWYHNFADQRSLLRMPHMLNVVSNLPFVVFGIMGLLFVLSPAAKQLGGSFADFAERWHYAVFFAASALTGIGSAYYHADPNNDRLLWDRLPLALAFMALFASIIGERIHRAAGNWLFVPLLVLGAGSVIYWHQTELHNAGDLRHYLLVQLYPLLALPLILRLFPAKYTRTSDLVGALACYVVAKVLELLDSQVYAVGGLVSGHTLKHLVAGGSVYLIVLMVKQRRPVVAPSPPFPAGSGLP